MTFSGLHQIVRADLVAGIEASTGRTVIAFFGENSLDPTSPSRPSSSPRKAKPPEGDPC
jgi:hypothetical protein